MKRLATFKALTWFGKPKSVSPINCARRGWINVDTDVITCEACGARLVFSTSSSWTMQQAEKVAAVFSLKLDNGHKMFCPWIDNACDKELALFPPTPPGTLVEGYKERASMLLKLGGLPVISSSAIDYMRSPQLEHFLSHGFRPSIVLGNGIKLTDGKDPECASEHFIVNMYYQALQIISLCGWEPRLLPYVVDCQKQSNILTKRSNSSTSSAQMPGQARQKVIVQSSSIPGGLEVGNHIHPSLGEDRHDPASVVLDCRFCGACVGLWAFPTTNCPMEIFRLVADYNDQTEAAVCSSDVVYKAESSKTQNSGEGNMFTEKGFALTVYDGSTTKERPMGLNFTIAGGPPPAEQNFRPRISFPVISRHLRAELGNIPGAENCIRSSISCGNQVNSRCHDAPSTTRKDTHDGLVCQPEGLGKRKRSEDAEKSDCVVNKAKTACVSYEQGELNLQETHSMHECSSGTMQNLKEFIGNRTGDLDRTETSSKELEKGLNTEVNAHDNDEVRESTFTTNPNEIIPAYEACENRSRSGAAVASNLNDSSLSESNLYHVESSENNNLDPAPSCSATNTALSNTPKSASDGKVCDSCNLGDAQVNGKNVGGLENKTLSSIIEADTADYELGNYELAGYPNIKGFDPIHQHRPFCPWIVTENGDGMPGWKLTLSALINREKDDSQSEAPWTPLDEEDDPLVSVRKLFMSPAKRLKSSQ